MTDAGFDAALRASLDSSRVHRNAPLAEFTTFKVGGPADWLIETINADEMVAALRLAADAEVPVTLLGGGSNVLIADAGIRGLVIRTRSGAIRQHGAARVEADAAVTINALVRWTIMRGIAGLESWAGTPGTVGGAIFGNAHFSGRHIGDLVIEARLASRKGEVRVVPGAELGFGYDASRLQQTGEVLLSAAFRVSEGDPSILRARARASLSYRKQTQPLDRPSAGCVFRNPERGRDEVPEGIPWSAGALIDRAGAKGWTVGGARVSVTHGNFIVNDGTATASDIRRLIQACRKVVHDKFGVDLREEIVFLGSFD